MSHVAKMDNNNIFSSRLFRSTHLNQIWDFFLLTEEFLNDGKGNAGERKSQNRFYQHGAVTFDPINNCSDAKRANENC